MLAGTGKGIDVRDRVSGEVIDLRRQYPMSHRWPVKQSAGLLAVLVASIVISTAIDHYFVMDMDNDWNRRAIQLMMASMMGLSFLLWFARAMLLEVELMHYDYRIQGGYLYISKGIFLKQKGSFPLSRITDIYLERGIGDFLFGLYNLHVSTPTASSGEFAYILGMREKNAFALQKRLTELVQENEYHIENIDQFVSGLARQGNPVNTKGGAHEKQNEEPKPKEPAVRSAHRDAPPTDSGHRLTKHATTIN